MSESVRQRLRRSVVAASAVVLTLAAQLSLARGAEPARVDFARQIRPILAEHCFECHGPDPKGRKGDLRLDARDEVLGDRGGNRLVVPGNPDESELIARVTSTDPDEIMPPPKSRRALSPAQVDLLKRWVAEGASWADHWSFTPPERPALPEVSNPGWCREPIDRFVLAALDRAGLSPSPEADRPTLLRRLCLDLTGLPPSPEQIGAFLADNRPGAYERQVDLLLASPHFGERWGRHWLDLVRYADSDGYEDDRYRPDAWRYRDWVVDAYNRDLPFDRFTVEQLAGDLLADPDPSEAVAAGFHRMAMFNRSAVGRDNEEEFRVKTAKDRAGTTAAVWLGLTMGCAECHTHKYDPLPHRDYYRFYAFFNNLTDTEVDATPLGGERLRAYQEAVSEFEAEQARGRKRLRDYEANTLPGRQTAWENAVDRSDLPAEVASALSVPAARRTAAQSRLISTYFKSIDPDYERLKADVLDPEMLANNRPPAPSTHSLTVAERKERRATHVQLRGDFLSPGEEVRPGTPAFLPPLRPRGTDADRLDLARWLVDPANPLTARVAVNALWQPLFGRGLAATPENFGLQGDPPSHPGLLDWLATEFVASGWSRKALVRRVVNSATYRQSSRPRDDLAAKDPTNALLGRQNRLRVDAEVVRDLGLAAAGLLNTSLGGPGIQPPLPASLLDRADLKSERLMAPSRGPDRYRRGVYVNVQRTLAYPMLKDFDVADPGAPCPRRDTSNTPLQALTLLNDPVFAECSRGLGLRAARESAGGEAGRARHAFRLALGRGPDGAEADVLSRLYREHRSLYDADPASASSVLGGEPAPAGVTEPEAAAWVAVARALLNLDEFITRE
jgi:hypothetical protein